MDGNYQDGKSSEELQRDYANLIRQQMALQGVSVRQLWAEGVIRNNHRHRFFERLAEGSLPISEYHAVNQRLEIDPIRAAITVQCFVSEQAYDDPCCQTSALVAVAMATHLPAELAACDGEFEALRDELCKGIAQKTSNAIAKHHRMIENRRNGGDFEFAYA